MPARVSLVTVLRANAVFSAVSGLVGLVDHATVASALGWARWIVVGLSAGLLVFAVALALASRLRGAALERAGRLVFAADAAWLLASVPVGLFFVPTTTAVLVVFVALDLAVLGFAVAEHRTIPFAAAARA